MSTDSELSTKPRTHKKRPHNPFDQFHEHPVCDIPDTGIKYVDTMDVYRPRRQDMAHVRDYQLSQAYTIMDRDPVKVHITDTDCDYHYHPKGYVAGVKKNAPCSHGPIGKFLNEQFVDVIEYHQHMGHKTLKQKLTKRTARIKADRRKLSNTITTLLGPDWFQELSNLQRDAIDTLPTAIVTDLSRNTIENTQFVMARLGLVLRPHHLHVKHALQLCASCPVEFLLVLYQLINPNRTSYSINDRLLLSAVMHLTIRSTLKELHVRIPSPPRAPPKPPAPTKRAKKVQPKSPYLQDLLLRDRVDHPCFHTRNKFFTNNKYFNYIAQMRCNNILLRATAEGDTYRDFQYEKTYSGGVCTCDNCPFPDCTAVKDLDEFTRIEIDLITEWTNAQKYYNSLVPPSDYITALFKPSVYVCPIGKFRPHAAAERKASRKALMSATSSEQSDVSLQPDSSLQLDVIKKCACPSSHQQTLQTLPTEWTKLTKSLSLLDQDLECMCSLDTTVDYLGNEEEEEGFMYETLSVTPPLPPCTVRDYDVGPLLSVKTVESQTCACRDAILKRIEESLCHCARCEDDRRRRNSFVKYIIDDTKETSEKSVPIVRGLKVTPICTCMEKYQRRWEKFERTRGVRKVQEALKSLDEKFVINGTAIGPDGKIVYILSSVQPKRCCQCAKLKELEEEEKRTLKQMPMLPGGCIKYHIAGVQERPGGNVYVLAGTTENTQCDCMALYDRFMREHSLCLKLYTEYMKKIAYDTEEYLKERNSDYVEFEASATWTESEVVVSERSCPCHCNRGTQMCCCYCQCAKSDLSVDCICSVQSCPCGFGRCECITEEGGVEDESIYEGGSEGECICTPNSENSNRDADLTICACTTLDTDTKLLGTESSKQVSKPSRSSKSGTAADDKKEVDAKKTEEEELMEKIKEAYKLHPLYKVEPPTLERYMIFKALPKTEQEQTTVLKKALMKLAEDGFPLARLPDVHKLPIFRAWWRYRLKQYHTARERNDMLNLVDRMLIQKMDRNRALPATVSSTFLLKSKHKHNWDYHSLIKARNMKDRTDYLRLTKHISINYARELYTLMRQYDFPNKTFHDVFFAYMPSKEEDILIDQIWKINEYKSQRLAQRC